MQCPIRTCQRDPRVKAFTQEVEYYKHYEELHQGETNPASMLWWGDVRFIQKSEAQSVSTGGASSSSPSTPGGKGACGGGEARRMGKGPRGGGPSAGSG